MQGPVPACLGGRPSILTSFSTVVDATFLHCTYCDLDSAAHVRGANMAPYRVSMLLTHGDVHDLLLLHTRVCMKQTSLQKNAFHVIVVCLQCLPTLYRTSGFV